MSAGQSVLDRLLDEIAAGTVTAERYSTKSMYGRCEQLLFTTVLAVAAILAGMVLGGASTTRSSSSGRELRAGFPPSDR